MIKFFCIRLAVLLYVVKVFGALLHSEDQTVQGILEKQVIKSIYSLSNVETLFDIEEDRDTFLMKIYHKSSKDEQKALASQLARLFSDQPRKRLMQILSARGVFEGLALASRIEIAKLHFKASGKTLCEFHRLAPHFMPALVKVDKKALARKVLKIILGISCLQLADPHRRNLVDCVQRLFSKHVLIQEVCALCNDFSPNSSISCIVQYPWASKSKAVQIVMKVLLKQSKELVTARWCMYCLGKSCVKIDKSLTVPWMLLDDSFLKRHGINELEQLKLLQRFKIRSLCVSVFDAPDLAKLFPRLVKLFDNYFDKRNDFEVVAVLYAMNLISAKDPRLFERRSSQRVLQIAFGGGVASHLSHTQRANWLHNLELECWMFLVESFGDNLAELLLMWSIRKFIRNELHLVGLLYDDDDCFMDAVHRIVQLKCHDFMPYFPDLQLPIVQGILKYVNGSLTKLAKLNLKGDLLTLVYYLADEAELVNSLRGRVRYFDMSHLIKGLGRRMFIRAGQRAKELNPLAKWE